MLIALCAYLWILGVVLIASREDPKELATLDYQFWVASLLWPFSPAIIFYWLALAIIEDIRKGL